MQQKNILPALLLSLAFLSAASPVVSAQPGPDNKGTEFMVAFMENFSGGNLRLFITGDTATSGTVEVPGLSFSTPFTVTPGAVTSVNLPIAAMTSGSDVTSAKGIRVTANDEVVVYGLNQRVASTDAFLGLPVDILGTDYIVLCRNESLSARNFSPLQGPSEFVVVGTVDNTQVTITPSVSTGARVAGVPYVIALNRFQTYQLKTDGALEDLSGTTITSDQPIALFAGGECLDIPNGTAFCDHIVEQLPPTGTWGTSFIAVSLATRTAGDLFRVIARDDGTQVQIDGGPATPLNRAQFLEVDLASGTAHLIEASGPVLVMQYSKGTNADNVTSDPFMMMVPPTQQFLSAYTVSTPAASPVSFNNFINVVVPTADIPSCQLDGSPIAPAAFTPVGATGFSAARVNVGIGTHNLVCNSPFGVYSYGWASADSYGYPGGLALEPIADIIEVEIDIKPGSYPNSINLSSNGSVPVAILSTPEFDARTIDPTTVTLAGASVRLKGKGSPMASFEDVNNDNLLDLVVHVSTQALELTSVDTEAIVEGQTNTDPPRTVRGKDSVRIVP